MKATLIGWALILVSGFAYGQSSIQLSGSIDGTDPLADTVGDEWCAPDDRVDVRPFTVSVTGLYGFENLIANPGDANIFIQINENPRHEYEPLINIDTYGESPVAAAPTGTLNAGQQYYLAAVTACTDLDETPVAFEVTLSGDGDIDIDPGTPEGPATPVPTLPFFGLLALGGLLGLFGVRQLKA